MRHLSDDNSLNAAVRATEALCRIGLQTSPAHIAVVDATGCVMLVNAAWQAFAKANGATGENLVSIGMNYLDICRKAAADADADAAAAYAGIASVLDGSLSEFSLAYPCHSSAKERWFRMNVAPLDAQENAGAIISHVAVTEHPNETMTLHALEAGIRSSFEKLMRFDAARSQRQGVEQGAEQDMEQGVGNDNQVQIDDNGAAEAAINAYYLAFDMTDLAKNDAFALRSSTRVLSEILADWAKETGDLPFNRKPRP